ncbi:MAG: lipoate--protein ligase family protein [Nitrospiraceae bacterium]|nr:lipoate--protein ligase family protein [Nitrospiraceae bacterium]
MNSKQDTREARLVINNYKDGPFMNMAIDEAILIAVSKGLVPTTVRFYIMNKPAVSIGYFQELRRVVNLSLCKKDNIVIFRRLTGGGAVYKDPKGELNYSVIIRENYNKNLRDVISSYKYLCNALIIGLKKLSINAEFKPINDIVVDGKKISGNAQTRSNGVILQHGTILLKVDIKKMFTYLKVSNEKIKDKMIKNAEERVTSLEKISPRTISFKEVENAIIHGFDKVLKANLKEEPLTEYERELAKKLYNDKYSKKEWNYWR